MFFCENSYKKGVNMQVEFSSNYSDKSDTLVILISESLKIGGKVGKIDTKIADLIKKAIQIRKFKGKKGDVLVITAPAEMRYNQLIIVGIGDNGKINDSAALSVGGSIYNALNSAKSVNADIVVEEFKEDYAVAANIAYGATLRSYRFDKYRTNIKDDKKATVESVNFKLDGAEKAKKISDKLQKIAEAVFLARDVVTEPPNKLYPESYAKIIEKNLSRNDVKVSLLSEKKLEELGMGALLGVGQGSIRESYVVVMEYYGSDNPKEKPVAFVGKGVTFDTGGISIKPALGMEDMKYDMGGSAAVFGVIKALSGRKAKVNAVGVVGLVENMPGHNAQRPSDVVSTMSGQTVEVLNTDAEGRLVLADVLTYVQEKHNPKVIVDLATLTGAIVIALGDQYAGLFSNNDKLSEMLINAANETEELLWRFPLSAEYDKLLDSEIADMQNISSGKGAGSITAAQFLKRFIKDDTAWAHLDIAGMAWTKKDLDVCPKGATAFGVRLLDKFVSDNYESY
jgi:leucyl aminopeptidase